MSNANALRRELAAFVNKNNLWTDVHFYSQHEWKMRGEEHLNNSPFVITFEGALYRVINCGNENEQLNNQFHAIIEKHGFYSEQGNSWNIGFYPKGLFL